MINRKTRNKELSRNGSGNEEMNVENGATRGQRKQCRDDAKENEAYED
jgi:hypothetical protein